MKEALQKSIGGGWRPEGIKCEGRTLSWIRQAVRNRSIFFERFLFDPLFWQSLGRAEGWKEGEIMFCVGCGKSLETKEVSAWNKHTGVWNGQKKDGCDSDVEHFYRGVWEIEWHNFINHLIEGKDADSFFDNLLKK